MPENKKKQDRQQRLSQALRDNLRKRKQQKRDKKSQKNDTPQGKNQPGEDK